LEKLVRLYYLPEMDTLDLWLDSPNKETVSEPISDNLVLKLDTNNKVIGVEVLSLSKLNEEDLAKLPKEVKETLISSLRKIANSVP